MPCLCPPATQSLTGLMPRANLSVSAVPPQMGHLMGLLGLENAGPSGAARADLRMGAMLPSMSGQAWLHSMMSSAMPGLPTFAMPRLMTMTAQMAAVGGSFPLQDPRALLAELQRTLRSLRAHLFPFISAAHAIPRFQLANMISAARMTLALRAQGLCPMALSGVDMSFSKGLNLGNPQARFSATVGYAHGLGATSVPSFGLPMPKLNLAMSLAALAPLASAPQTLGLPAISDPNFAAMAMSMLQGLASIPSLPFNIGQIMADLTRLSDLSAINQAFGADAMSSAGVLRVQNMLNFFARLGLPQLPSAALSLQPKLDMLPSMDTVMTGANVARTGAATFAMSTRFNPMMPLILPLLTALEALRAVLGDALGTMPAGACSTCRMVA